MRLFLSLTKRRTAGGPPNTTRSSLFCSLFQTILCNAASVLQQMSYCVYKYLLYYSENKLIYKNINYLYSLRKRKKLFITVFLLLKSRSLAAFGCACHRYVRMQRHTNNCIPKQRVGRVTVLGQRNGNAFYMTESTSGASFLLLVNACPFEC